MAATAASISSAAGPGCAARASSRMRRARRRCRWRRARAMAARFTSGSSATSREAASASSICARMRGTRLARQRGLQQRDVLGAAAAEARPRAAARRSVGIGRDDLQAAERAAQRGADAVVDAHAPRRRRRRPAAPVAASAKPGRSRTGISSVPSARRSSRPSDSACSTGRARGIAARAQLLHGVGACSAKPPPRPRQVVEEGVLRARAASAAASSRSRSDEMQLHASMEGAAPGPHRRRAVRISRGGGWRSRG